MVGRTKSIKNRGFTIVELLIVIVIIGILAAIVIVAYNGVQTRALNTARVSEAKEWQKIVTQYVQLYDKSNLGSTGASVCIGEGFPDYNADSIGDCWDLNGACCRVSMSTATNNELKKIVTSFPQATRTPIVGSSGVSRMGPVITLGSPIGIRYWMQGTSCPIGTQSWNDAGVTVACTLTIEGT